MGMPRDDAEELTRRFLRDYPGALELAYKFRETTAELYGRYSDKVPADMKGSYLPEETIAHNGRTYRGRVDIPLENIQDASDLLITLRHEVLGHYGTNTFTPAEKRALLDGVIAGRESSTLKPLWNDVNGRYASASLDMLAEEVIALQSEGIAARYHIGNNQVQHLGERSFQETCIARVRPMGADDLHNIVCMVAQGLHDRTRTQQTFPEFNELFRKGNTAGVKKPFHEVVAERLIEQLKGGTAPWQKCWNPGEPNAYLPINPTTGKRYRGVNAIYLMAQGRGDNRWMTYKQAKAAGAQVKKGEKGTLVRYWKFSEEQKKLDEQGRPLRDANGEKIKETVQFERPRVFFATAFNAEQIDGLPSIPQKTEQQWNAVERAENILNASGAKITHVAGDRAYYGLSSDSITLPEKSQFESADRYYATALHELGHWTGHPSRLDRDLAHPFGSEGYAKEELRAEIGSMMVGDELGIGHDPEQHAAYVGSWIKVLEDDPREILCAASAAEKIHEFIIALEPVKTQESPPIEKMDSRFEAFVKSKGLSEESAQRFKAFLEEEPVKKFVGSASSKKSKETELQP